MPAAAFGGRRDIMAKLAPLGGVYQAGTLSGNPLAVAAGLTTLKLIQAPGFHDQLAAQTRKLADGLTAAARAANVPFAADAIGGMFGLYFTPSRADQLRRGDRRATWATSTASSTPC